MKSIKIEISFEQYQKAVDESPYSLLPDSIVMGCGAYNAKVTEQDNRYFLYYEMGNKEEISND